MCLVVGCTTDTQELRVQYLRQDHEIKYLLGLGTVVPPSSSDTHDPGNLSVGSKVVYVILGRFFRLWH